MKALLAQVLGGVQTPEEKKNMLRDYLQEYFLFTLYRKKLYTDIVFCGGTALRFLYRTKRFSEDLDFSVDYGTRNFSMRSLADTIKKEFEDAGYDIAITCNEERNVRSALLKFQGLLYEFDISQHMNEKLSIKIEVDTNPPAGARDGLTLHNRNFMFQIHHYDLQSLFAGKVHALLTRTYTKGRDWYDLIWYVSRFKDIEPNYEMLNNALAQTGHARMSIDNKNWKQSICAAAEKLDEKHIQQDVYRFLEDPAEKEFITKETILRLLSGQQ